MNIGEAAKAAGVSAKTIRYYESIGLISPAGRSAAGYRRYGERDVHTLRFIREARALGFPIDELRTLLALWSDTARPSAEVRRLAQAHIVELETRITAMQAIVRTLSTLVDACHGDARPDCPILDTLAGRRTPG